MPDLEISKLPPITGTLLQPTDPLPLADLSASETKSITVKELIQGGVALIDAGSIPSDKLNFTLGDSSITAAKLANKAVTAAKLDDNSSVVVAGVLPAVGAFIGQLGVNTTTGEASVWGGAGWVSFTGSQGVNRITFDNTSGPIDIGAIVNGTTYQLGVLPKDTAGPAMFMAGPATAGGTVNYRQLESVDLPIATTVRGAVAVNGNGLKLTGDVIGIDNSVTASGTTYGVVQYDSHGLVVAGRRITGGDLPIATTTDIGAVRPGPDLAVAPDGALTHINGITAGTAAKVIFDSHGHVTGTAALTAADIPALDAGSFTTGTIPAGRIGAKTITAEKLADYAIALIQESVPVAGVGSHPIGMTWLQESTGQVSIWNGNSWMKTGASTLFNRNLRYCGTYSPATGLINGVTQFGTAEGFKVTDPIPAADDKIAGSYFVATVAGSSSSIAGGASFDPGDWLLCQGTSGGWVRIDTLSGAGGGGGGTDHLDGLLDVTLTSPKVGDILHYTAAGQWVNVAFTDAGTY